MWLSPARERSSRSATSSAPATRPRRLRRRQFPLVQGPRPRRRRRLRPQLLRRRGFLPPTSDLAAFTSYLPDDAIFVLEDPAAQTSALRDETRPRRRRSHPQRRGADLPARRLLRRRGELAAWLERRAALALHRTGISGAAIETRVVRALRGRPRGRALAGHARSVGPRAGDQGRARLARQDRRARPAGAADRRLARGGHARHRRRARRDAGGAPDDAAPPPRPHSEGPPRRLRSRAPSAPRPAPAAPRSSSRARSPAASSPRRGPRARDRGRDLRLPRPPQSGPPRAPGHRALLPRGPAHPRRGRLRGPRRSRHRPLPRPRPQAGWHEHRRSHRGGVRRRRQALSAGLSPQPDQKFSGSEGAPKVDRLGGQTFEKTKARVQKNLRKMADRAPPPLRRAARGAGRGAAAAGRRLPRLRGHLPLRRDPGSGPRHPRGGVGPHRATPDGSPGLRRRRLRQDRGGHPRRLPRRDLGLQVAVLCPTTVLAQQHWRSFQARMESYPINVASMSRFQTKQEQDDVSRRLREGRSISSSAPTASSPRTFTSSDWACSSSTKSSASGSPTRSGSRPSRPTSTCSRSRPRPSRARCKWR